MEKQRVAAGIAGVGYTLRLDLNNMGIQYTGIQ